MTTLEMQYDLNNIMNESNYDELLEIYNSITNNSILTEGIASIPMNKAKQMLKKISSFKNPKQMESFIKSNKKFVKSEKDLNVNVKKLAKKLNYTDAEVQASRVSIMKSLALISQFAGLASLLGIPLIIIIMLIAAAKGKSLSEVTDQILDDIKVSIRKDVKGPYETSIQNIIWGLIIYIGSLIVMLLGGALAVDAIVAIGAIGFLVGLILLIISVISFMWTFVTTPLRD